VLRFPGNDSRHGTALEYKLLAGVQIGHGTGRLELGDGGDGDRRLFLGVILFLVGLVVNLGEEFGGNAGAAFQRTNLSVLDRDPERVLSAGRGHRGQSVVGGVGAGFAGKMNGNGCPGSRILGVVSPGVCGGLVGDFGRFKRNRRVASAIEAFRPLKADAKAPVGLVAKGDEEDGVVLGLRSRWSHRRILLCGGGFRLTVRWQRRKDTGEHHKPKKELRPLGNAQGIPPRS